LPDLVHGRKVSFALLVFAGHYRHDDDVDDAISRKHDDYHKVFAGRWSTALVDDNIDDLILEHDDDHTNNHHDQEAMALRGCRDCGQMSGRQHK
jgi:hypothetical protein